MSTFFAWLGLFVFFVGCVFLGVMLWQNLERIRQVERQEREAKRRAEETEAANAKLQERNRRLERWASVDDADTYAQRLRQEAEARQQRLVAEAEAERQRAAEEAAAARQQAQDEAAALRQQADQESKQTLKEARARAKELTAEAQAMFQAAGDQAAGIVGEALAKAEKMAGNAWAVVQDADHFERTAKAMKNIVDGYGKAYLKPSHSLLDDLADEFDHTDAGRNLKAARKKTEAMVANGQAAACDYAENNRREMAERFVVDAFNGKVDSILSRVRHDNHGTLEQEVRDAFTIVNHGGQPFRNARITDLYLRARLDELRWAATAQELRRQQQEEQRRIREQIREEEKARRDYERAKKEAEREERLLREAMAKAQEQIATATEAQRAEYERQMAELAAKLHEAEEKNQRAMSMAQQTKRGHVYVVSNVGSFGEGVYKIGLTRRLEPLDRIKELGDASVPFDFDVHAMLFADDAPALEHKLHDHFVRGRVNKVNHRKEFFRADIADIRREVEEMGVQAHWTMLADAAEWRESQVIEERIGSDPEAMEAWLNRQLVLEAEEADEAGEDELVGLGRET